MAERKESEDEFNPRHRIVGAVILVALAVIFLPMVLNDEPPPTGTAPVVETPVAEPLVTGVSPADQAAPAAVADPGLPVAPTRSTRIVTVPVDTAPPPESAGNPPSVKPAPPVAAPRPPAAGIEPSPGTAPPPAAAAVGPGKQTPVAPRPATKAGGWVVQVGVFSQADNARRLQERLKARGYAVRLDPPGAPWGKTVRVEVGPYRDQAAAKSAAARIQREFEISGIVRAQ